jgi:hypothetical protein
MSRGECLSDLVARSRSYRLSDTEQRQLERHLAICESCRRDRQIGREFDAVSGLQRGDDRLIARLGESALARIHVGPKRRSRMRGLWVGALLACLFFSAAAGARAVWHVRGGALHPFPSDATSGPVGDVPEHPIFTITAGPHLQGLLSVPVPTDPSAAIRPSRRGGRRQSVPAPLAPADDSAAYLFASANEERRRAHPSSAMALYGDLQSRHPTSEEAAVSCVSLGWLLLAKGSISEALSQFDHYLDTSPRGLLAPEALFAKAQALRANGQRDEERKTWNALLSRFADSVYASEAWRRVEALR